MMLPSGSATAKGSAGAPPSHEWGGRLPRLSAAAATRLNTSCARLTRLSFAGSTVPKVSNHHAPLSRAVPKAGGPTKASAAELGQASAVGPGTLLAQLKGPRASAGSRR